jgi:ribosome maturation factor RimP
MNIEQKVLELLKPEVEKLDCRLFDVIYEKVGNDNFLRILLDSDQPIDLDKCVSVSEVVSPILDEENPIEEVYYLDVSSKGAEPELKTDQHITDSIGKYVYVKTYAQIDGIKEFVGDLLGFEDKVVTIECNIKGIKKKFDVPQDKIAKIRLSVHL